MTDFHVLVPTATTNLITNPSVENDLSGWTPSWSQEATFEDEELTPNPTGFDATSNPALLSIIGPAAFRGNWGLAVTLDGLGTNTYGAFTDPDSEDVITFEFFLNANTLNPSGNFPLVRAYDGATDIMDSRLTFAGGSYQLDARAKDDGAGWDDIGTFDIPATGTLIRYEWAAATGAGANDGIIRLYIDGTLAGELTNVDNDTRAIDEIRIGALSADAVETGVFYLDNIRWADSFVPFTGSSLESTLERARFGRRSMKVYTDGNQTNEGPYFRIDASEINSAMAGSLYVRGSGKIRIRLFDGFKGGSSVSEELSLTDDRWQRLEVSGRVGGSDDYRLYVETVGVQETIFYIDGAMIEEQEEATSYCDGTLEGCRWNGVAHASTSSRSATEMSGGVWTPIRDEECNPDTYVTVFGGFGMAPTRINRQRTALSPGSVFDSATVLERILTLNIWVKDEDAQGIPGRGQLRIKELRQTLIDLIKLDVSPDTEPFFLRVTDDGAVPLMIKCRYEGGLEFDSDARDKWRNTIPLRLLCLDPFWEEDGQEIALLDTEIIIGDARFAMARVDGLWRTAINGFAGGSGPLAIEEDENGRLYFGGNFQQDDDGNQLRRFGSTNDDFSLVLERATGMNNQVIAIAAHPNGKIYLGGAFTGDNAGNLFDRVAEYDPVADTFAALAGGIDDFLVYSIFVAPNGNVYFAGSFTTVNGDPMNQVAYWDGQWHSVGDIEELGVASFQAWDIYVVSDDEVYVVGRDQAGATDIVLAQWDGSDWISLFTTSQVVVGPPIGRSIIRDNDGTFVFCGETENDAQTNMVGRVWRWNGSAATQLGDDLVYTPVPASSSASEVALHPDGTIFVTGTFDTIGDLAVRSAVAIWNGSTFAQSDLYVISANTFGALEILENGDVYVSVQSSVDNVEAAARTTVLNRSTSDVFPVISFTGTGRLIWLENQTTGQRVYLSYVLQENEILTFDFRTGAKTVESNYRGSVPDAILPNSDDFFLAAGNLDDPKENIISVLVADEVDPVVQLRYTPTHWSVDAGAN
jgi:hypothetical protein